MKAKGVNLRGSPITHIDYRRAFVKRVTITIPQTRITSKVHQLYTIKNQKVALSCEDDKRFWVSANKSVAYGHYLDKSISNSEDMDILENDDGFI